MSELLEALARQQAEQGLGGPAADELDPMTSGRAFKLGFGMNVAPATASALALLGIASAVPTGGLGPLALGLLGSIGAGVGTGYLQNKVLEKTSPETLQAYAQAREQNPMAAMMGGLSSGLVGWQAAPGTMARNARMAFQGPKGLTAATELGEGGVGLLRDPATKLLHNADDISRARSSAALMLGGQAGLGGLFAAGMPLIQGEAPSGYDIAEGALANVLFGNPRGMSKLQPVGLQARSPRVTGDTYVDPLAMTKRVSSPDQLTVESQLASPKEVAAQQAQEMVTQHLTSQLRARHANRPEITTLPPEYGAPPPMDGPLPLDPYAQSVPEVGTGQQIPYRPKPAFAAPESGPAVPLAREGNVLPQFQDAEMNAARTLDTEFSRSVRQSGEFTTRDPFAQGLLGEKLAPQKWDIAQNADGSTTYRLKSYVRERTAPPTTPDAVLDSTVAGLEKGDVAPPVKPTDLPLKPVEATVLDKEPWELTQKEFVGNRQPESADFTSKLLSQVEPGKPGLETKPSVVKVSEGVEVEGQLIVYRNSQGQPVAAAKLVEANGKLSVFSFASDKKQGLLSAKAAVEVGKEIERLGAAWTAGTMSPDAAKVYHHRQVQKASQEGKPVSAEVLADYPHLKKKTTPPGPILSSDGTPGVKPARKGTNKPGPDSIKQKENLDTLESLGGGPILKAMREEPLSPAARNQHLRALGRVMKWWREFQTAKAANPKLNQNESFNAFLAALGKTKTSVDQVIRMATKYKGLVRPDMDGKPSELFRLLDWISTTPKPAKPKAFTAPAKKESVSDDQITSFARSLAHDAKQGFIKARRTLHLLRIRIAMLGQIRETELFRVKRGDIDTKEMTITFTQIKGRKGTENIVVKKMTPELLEAFRSYTKKIDGQDFDSIAPEKPWFKGKSKTISEGFAVLSRAHNIKPSSIRKGGNIGNLVDQAHQIAADKMGHGKKVNKSNYSDPRVTGAFELLDSLQYLDPEKQAATLSELKALTDNLPEGAGVKDKGLVTVLKNRRKGQEGSVTLAPLESAVKAAENIAKAIYRQTSNLNQAVVAGLRKAKEVLGEQFSKFAAEIREKLHALFGQKPPPTPSDKPGMKIAYGMQKAQARRSEAGAVGKLTGKEGIELEGLRYNKETQAVDIADPAVRQEVLDNPQLSDKDKVKVLQTGSLKGVKVAPKPSTEPKPKKSTLAEGLDLAQKAAGMDGTSVNELKGLKMTREESFAMLGEQETSPWVKELTNVADTTEGTRKQRFLDQFDGAVKSVMNKVRRLDKVILPIDAAFDALDGAMAKFNGFLTTVIRKPIDLAWGVSANLNKQWTKEVNDLVSKYRFKERDGKMIGVYLYSLQKGGMERLEHSGWSKEMVERNNAKLTPQHLETAQAMQRAFKEIAPHVQRELYAEHGIQLTVLDSYFPIMRDHERFIPGVDKLSEIMVKKGEIITMDDLMNRTHQFAEWGKEGSVQTDKTFSIERVDKPDQPIKLDSFEVFDRRVRDMAHFVSMERLLRDRAKMVRWQQFRDKYGDEGQKYVMDFLNAVATNGRNAYRNRWLDSFRKRTSLGVIGGRMSSQFVHLANIPLSLLQLHLKSPGNSARLWWKGLEMSQTPEGKAWLDKYARETVERGTSEPATKELATKTYTYEGKAERWGFAVMRKIDQVNTQATALGLYMADLELKGKNPLDFHKLPVDWDSLTDAMLRARRSVASPLTKDVPQILSRGGSVFRSLFQFQNVFLDQYSNIRHEGVAAFKKARKGDSSMAAAVVGAVTGMLAIETGIKYGFKELWNTVTGYESDKHSDKSKFDKHRIQATELMMHEAFKRIPFAGQLETVFRTLVRSSEGEKGDLRVGVPALDTAIALPQRTYEMLTSSKNDKGLNVLRFLTSAGTAYGLVGAGQTGEIAQRAERASMRDRGVREVAQVAGKKSVHDMPLSERFRISHAINLEREPRTPLEKKREQIRGARSQFYRQEEVMERINPAHQNWLKSMDLSPAGYKGTLRVNGTSVILAAKERQAYSKLIVEATDKAIELAKRDPLFKTITPKQREERWRYFERRFHDQAEKQLIYMIANGQIKP
jgi:hypothetical protein